MRFSYLDASEEGPLGVPVPVVCLNAAYFV
jgi:hypothetical protein